MEKVYSHIEFNNIKGIGFYIDDTNNLWYPYTLILLTEDDKMFYYIISSFLQDLIIGEAA